MNVGNIKANVYYQKDGKDYSRNLEGKAMII